jgi:hypothetical protein
VNFTFLASHDPALTEFPVRAKFYCFEDPNAALKLRQWCEMVAQAAEQKAKKRATEPVP